MERKYKSLGINTVLVFVGKLGSGLITFFMLPLYTRWLGPEEFGLAELVNTYSNIILSVATCCMADAIFIFPKTSDEVGKKKYFTSGLVVACLGIILAFLLSLILKSSIFSEIGTFHTNSSQIILLSSCLFFQNYTQQFTRCINKMTIYSASGVILSFAIAIYALLLIPIHGVDGYIYSLELANITAAVFSFIASGLYKYFNLDCFEKDFSFRLLKYGVPLIPNSIMWWLVDGINRPIMEAKMGLTAIGIYAVASKFPSILNVISGAFSNAWGISVSEEYGKEDFNQYFNKIFKLVFFVLMFFSILISILSKPIIIFFTTAEYIEAYKLLPILLLSVIFSNASGLVGGIFMVKKQSKYFFYSSTFGAIVSVVSTLFLVDLYGVYGVAWSAVVSFLVMSLVRIYYIWNDIKTMNVLYYVKSLLLYILLIMALLYLDSFLKYVVIILLLCMHLSINKSLILSIGFVLKTIILKR